MQNQPEIQKEFKNYIKNTDKVFNDTENLNERYRHSLTIINQDKHPIIARVMFGKNNTHEDQIEYSLGIRIQNDATKALGDVKNLLRRMRVHIFQKEYEGHKFIRIYGPYFHFIEEGLNLIQKNDPIPLSSLRELNDIGYDKINKYINDIEAANLAKELDEMMIDIGKSESESEPLEANQVMIDIDNEEMPLLKTFSKKQFENSNQNTLFVPSNNKKRKIDEEDEETSSKRRKLNPNEQPAHDNNKKCKLDNVNFPSSLNSSNKLFFKNNLFLRGNKSTPSTVEENFSPPNKRRKIEESDYTNNMEFNL